MPAIKFDDVQGLEPIPAGIYMASVTKATEGISKKDNPKIDLQWTVSNEDDPKVDGRIIFDTMVFTEKALFRVKQVLEAGDFLRYGVSPVLELLRLLDQVAHPAVEFEESVDIEIDTLGGNALPHLFRIFSYAFSVEHRPSFLRDIPVHLHDLPSTLL